MAVGFTLYGTTYTGETALKGSDYVHLLDSDGNLVAAFDGVTDFSPFVLTEGSWTTPTAVDDCNLAVIGEDGIIRKGSHKCSDIVQYTHPTYTARTGVPTANQTPAFGATFSVNQVVSDATGHVTAVTSRTVKIPNTAASASAAGLMTTGTQTFAGNKTFNGVVDCNGASAVATAQARNIYAGTTDMTAGTTALETGAIYLVYE